MPSRLAGCLLLACLLLIGCRGSPERREIDRQRTEVTEAVDAYRALALREIDAAEQGDAAAIRNLWLAGDAWSQEWVDLHAEAGAALGRVWPRLVGLAGGEQQAYGFLIHQSRGGPTIETDSGGPRFVTDFDTPFDRLRANVRGLPTDVSGGPVASTPRGPRLDATLPDPDGSPETTEEIEARIGYLASYLAEDASQLLYIAWIARELDGGVESMNELGIDRFAANISPLAVTEVTQRTARVLEGLREAALEAGLSEMPANLATSIEQTRQSADTLTTTRPAP